ncbi:organic Anion Transporter Polypeptide family protein, partial [Oesophagostomum dentatum]
LLKVATFAPSPLHYNFRNRLVETSQTTRRRTPECCGLTGTNKTAALYRDAPSQEDSTLLLTTITSRGRGPLWYKLWLDVRHIPIAIYRILTNAPFMLITLAMAIDSLVVTGASSFMSKYLERQFSVPPSNSSFLIGCVMVPMAGIGCMISGFIVQYFRLNCVTTLKLSVGLLFFSLILTPMYLIYCPHDPLIGVETTYPDRNIIVANNAALAMVILTSVLMVYGGTLQDDPLPDIALKEVEPALENGDKTQTETAAPLLQ